MQMLHLVVVLLTFNRRATSSGGARLGRAAGADPLSEPSMPGVVGCDPTAAAPAPITAQQCKEAGVDAAPQKDLNPHS